MEIKVGGVYNNRSGDKCTVYKMHDEGFMYVNHTYDETNWVNLDGCDIGMDQNDLVSEWSEPRTGYVNIYRVAETGKIASGSPQDTAEECEKKSEPIYNATFVRIACVKFTEGQFDD